VWCLHVLLSGRATLNVTRGMLPALLLVLPIWSLGKRAVLASKMALQRLAHSTPATLSRTRSAATG
jgi:hypothetical protein